MKQNLGQANFRVFGPDETASNRLDAVYQATDKVWMEHTLPVDEHLSRNGRVMEKKADIIRLYLPPDANTLLSVADHCLSSHHYVKVIVADKQPAPQWLD